MKVQAVSFGTCIPIHPHGNRVSEDGNLHKHHSKTVSVTKIIIICCIYDTNFLVQSVHFIQSGLIYLYWPVRVSSRMSCMALYLQRINFFHLAQCQIPEELSS
jgi:hypothetical protein